MAIVGDQGHINRQGLGGDHQVIWSDQLAPPLQLALIEVSRG